MKAQIPVKITSLALAVFLIIASSPYPAQCLEGLALQYPHMQRGMSYVTWAKEGFASASSDESLAAMRVSGVTSVAIIVTWYQEEFNSLDIAPTDYSPSDESVRHVIRKARQLGMNVMLKPHVDLIKDEGNTRSDIGFQEERKWSAWFDSYTNFVTHYAELGQEENADFFCAGTELSFASTKKEYWTKKVIPAIRRVFRGYITYAANWDEYADIGFWGDLDYAGIDAYFPVCEHKNPALDEIRQGWKKWAAEIEAFQQKIGKPIVFTESGYCSADSAAQKPWEDIRKGVSNPRLQEDCYRALLETFWDKPWFFGVYWWNWNTYAGSGGPENSTFTPQNKPAIILVKSWYERPLGTKTAFTMSMPLSGDAETLARLNVAEIKGKEAAGAIPVSGTIAGRPERAEKK